MTEKEIFDCIVTIIQERQGEDFAVTEALSLKDDLGKHNKQKAF